MAKPPHKPKSFSSGGEQYSVDQKELYNYYSKFKEQASCIPYGAVTRQISLKVSDHLTHPTPLLKDNRWMDVIEVMSQVDLPTLGKYDYWKNWSEGKDAETPFYLFLVKHYGPKDNGTLWGLIDALWKSKCTDVLKIVKNDITEFVSSYKPNMLQETLPSENSLESGFVEGSLLSTGSSSPFQGNASMQTRSQPHNVTVLQDVLRRQELLLHPDPKEMFLNSIQNMESNKREVPVRPFIFPKQEDNYFPPNLHDAFDGQLPDFGFPSKLDCFKSPDLVSIFMPHTQKEEDEEKAEEIARKLREKFQFDILLMKDIWNFIELDVPSCAMKVMEKVDFVVPVLSRAYLEEIQPIGDPNEMPNERLVVRYFHAVSLSRVINKNSLNFLIRPLIVNDANYGMVRRWHEFQCALRYPKDLDRLGRNLQKTKQMLLQRSININ